MAFIDWIRRCNRRDLDAFLPLYCTGIHLGWIHAGLTATLAGEQNALQVGQDAVVVNPALASADARTHALASIVERWRVAGLWTGWTDEFYPATTALGVPPLFVVARAAAPLLGLRAWGVHVNGYVRRDDRLHVWVGKRAADRPVAPGKLDHLVAGGLPVGIAPRANLIKEAGEEAGLPPEVAGRAIATGLVSYCYQEPPYGLRADTLLTWDLALSPDVEPRNMDGEVEHFELWPVARLAEAVRDGDAFKPNCNLVIIDFLIRHGVLTPDDTPDYEALTAGLRPGFPGVPSHA